MNQTIIPATVPKSLQRQFIEHYQAITHDTNRLFLFSCDQKIEHLNQDFYSYPATSVTHLIHTDAMHPEHLFYIAQQGRIGAMAAHPGLISRYGRAYPSINYIAKLNGKTNLVPVEHKEPLSAPMWTVEDVALFKENANLLIRGVGLTVYLGSEYENEMLSFAAQQVQQAHEHGLIAILWMYIRGKVVTDDRSHELIAGACGVAASLGADFVKVKAPCPTKELSSVDALHIAVAAAGNTKVICSGGKLAEPNAYLQTIYDQIHKGHTAGTATGRNVFQRSRADAVAMTFAISAVVYDDKTPQEALALFEEVRKK